MPALSDALHRCSLATALTCVALYVSAAGAEELSEQEFLADIPLVLTASRLAQPVSEAPMATTVIDRDMIRASGFRQIADLMRLVPGMYVGYFKGDQPVVSYHGLSDAFSRRMQVLVDGRSVYMPSLGGVEWDDLPMSVDDIERIEVIRGPDAAAYGSNSFLAVINIITVAPVQAAGTSAHLGAGDAGTREATVRHGGTLGDLAYWLGAGYHGDQGFYDAGVGADGQRAAYLNAAGDYRVGDTDRLHFYAGVTESHRAGDLIPCNTNCPDHQAVRSHFEQLRWTRQVDDSNEFSLQLFHDRFDSHETAFDFIPVRQPDGSLPTFTFQSPVRTERFDAELQQTHTASPTLRWVWGANARREDLYAPLFFYTEDTLSSHLLRAFAHAEWRPAAQWLVQAGAMAEDTSIAGSSVSPEVAVNWHLTSSQTLRASASSAMRTPLQYEDHGHNVMRYGAYAIPNVVALGDQRPESIVSREAGWMLNLPERHLSVDVKVFSDRLTDLIDTRLYRYPANPDNGLTTTYQNLKRANQQGVEGTLDLGGGDPARLVLNAARVRTFSPDQRRYGPAMPANTLSALLIGRFPGNLEGSLGYYQMSSLQMLQVFDASDHVPLMRRLDARLAWHFGPAERDSEIAVTAQNLLAGYHDYFLYNVFRQRLLVSLSTHL